MSCCCSFGVFFTLNNSVLRFKELILSLLQIYFYADYVFRQSGIPEDKIRYVTVGTGACECLTALTCVSNSVFTITNIVLNTLKKQSTLCTAAFN